MVLVFREKTDKNTEDVTNPFGVSMPRCPLAISPKNIDISIKTYPLIVIFFNFLKWYKL